MAPANIFKITDVYRQWANRVGNDTLPFEQFTTEFATEFSKRPRKVEKRESERTELPPIPAEAQPLNSDFKPEGKPFFVMVRNISANGIGLMFGEEIQCKYLQLRLETPSGKQLKTVIEVKHCTANGIMIGGSAVAELRLS